MSRDLPITPGSFDPSVGGGGGGGAPLGPWTLDVFLYQPSTDPNDGGFVPLVASLDPKRRYMFGLNPFGPPPGGVVTLGWIYPPQWYSSIDIQNQTANLFSALLNDAGFPFMDIGSGPCCPAMVVDPIGEGTFVSDGGLGFPIQDVAGTISSDSGASSFMSCSQTSPTTFAIEKWYQDNGVNDMAWAVFSQQMRP